MDAPGSRLPALVVAFLGICLASTPAFAQYPQDAAIAGASDTTVSPGQPIVVGGEGWKPRTRVELRWPSGELGHAEADEQGEFSTTVSIPEGSHGGEQFIRVAGTSGTGQSSEIAIRMLVEGEPEDEVSFTGTNITLWTLLAMAFFLVGLGAVLRGRRRMS